MVSVDSVHVEVLAPIEYEYPGGTIVAHRSRCCVSPKVRGMVVENNLRLYPISHR